MVGSLKKEGKLFMTQSCRLEDLKVHPTYQKIEFNGEEPLHSLGLLKTDKEWLWVKAIAKVPVEPGLVTNRGKKS
jgi:hypothetical protein